MMISTKRRPRGKAGMEWKKRLEAPTSD